MSDDDGQQNKAREAATENLADSLADRDGGELFRRDLEDARLLAAADPRFDELVEGLDQVSLGKRMAAVNQFFKGFDPAELASLELPVHLGQLRAIFLSSR